MADVRADGARGTATRSLDAQGETIIALQGEFDVSNVESDLRPALDAIDAAPGGLVLDARELEFIDSSGIAVLLQCVERLGPMKVRQPSVIFTRLIEISGLGGRLQVEL